MASDQDPSYRRVLDGVLAAIRDGTYPPGGRLPSGSDLGERYGVHRSAASRAVDRLRWIGLVVGPAGGISRVADEPRRTAALRLIDEANRLRGDLDDPPVPVRPDSHADGSTSSG